MTFLGYICDFFNKFDEPWVVAFCIHPLLWLIPVSFWVPFSPKPLVCPFLFSIKHSLMYKPSGWMTVQYDKVWILYYRVDTFYFRCSWTVGMAPLAYECGQMKPVKWKIGFKTISLSIWAYRLSRFSLVPTLFTGVSLMFLRYFVFSNDISNPTLAVCCLRIVSCFCWAF